MSKKYAFSRAHRLTCKFEFDSVFNEAQKVSYKNFIALFKKSSNDCTRLGLIVSKRIAKLAVTRNCIKRIIRESFRFKKNQISGYDIVIITRYLDIEPNKPLLRKNMDELWKKIIHY